MILATLSYRVGSFLFHNALFRDLRCLASIGVLMRLFSRLLLCRSLTVSYRRVRCSQISCILYLCLCVLSALSGVDGSQYPCYSIISIWVSSGYKPTDPSRINHFRSIKIRLARVWKYCGQT